MGRELVVVLPIAMDTLVGMCIDNMLNFVATLSGSKLRYGVLDVGNVSVPYASIPNGVDVLIDTMSSNAMYNAVSRIWGSVDGFCARIVGASTVQDWVRNAVSPKSLEDFLESLKSVELTYERSDGTLKLIIRWGSKGRWIKHNLVPFQLRSAELLEGARTPYPRQLVIEQVRKGKKKEEELVSGSKVLIEIDSYVYAFIVASIAASTLNIEIDRRGRIVREYRCVCYRLTGYDASRILQILVDRYRSGQIELPSSLLASRSKIFSKDMPEILAIHYVLAKLSNYVSRFYNARLDLAFYHVAPGKRADIDLSISIHFMEYRNLLDLLVDNRNLANDYVEAIETIANLLTSNEEERQRAGSLGLELTNYVDRIARDIYTLEDLYNVLRIIEQIKGSALYTHLSSVLKTFERLVNAFLHMRSRKLVR